MDIGGTEKVILQLCKTLKSDFNKIIVCSTYGVHVKDLNDFKIKHYTIPDMESKNLINVIKSFLIIRKVIKEEQIHIVHTHHRMAAFYGRVLNIFNKYIHIHTAHNTFYNKRMFTKFSLSKSKIICVGEKVKENLINYFKIKNDSIEVIYNGVERNTIEKKPIPELIDLKKQGNFIVGNIGRLSEQKGFPYFIEACRLIKQINSEIKLCIIGDGELREELMLLSKKYELEDTLLFLGYRNDIENVIDHCDLLVLSSLWEGLPLTPMEVFMQKKTLIATGVDGTLEVVEHMKNGLIIKPKDSIAIKDSILELYGNRELLYQLEQNAYETYERKFDISIFIKNYREFYNKLKVGE